MSGAAEAHTAAPAPTRVARLVDAAITRNTLAIEHVVIAELKRMCRASDEAIVALYAALMAKLGGAHPLPRLLALRVCDVFFRRSHLFRTLVVDELNEFFALTLGVVRSRPLPPPTKTAAYLRAEGVHKALFKPFQITFAVDFNLFITSDAQVCAFGARGTNCLALLIGDCTWRTRFCARSTGW